MVGSIKLIEAPEAPQETKLSQWKLSILKLYGRSYSFCAITGFIMVQRLEGPLFTPHGNLLVRV